ncbi:MAG TPA: hypothetical protein VM940_06555, partial [Chthoniobacterales bacterium]|nr:hypothetical protein [Chthoniobacterales bacterium]
SLFCSSGPVGRSTNNLKRRVSPRASHSEAATEEALSALDLNLGDDWWQDVDTPEMLARASSVAAALWAAQRTT